MEKSVLKRSFHILMGLFVAYLLISVIEYPQDFVMWILAIFSAVCLIYSLTTKDKKNRLVFSVVFTIIMLFAIGYQLGKDRVKIDNASTEMTLNQ